MTKEEVISKSNNLVMGNNHDVQIMNPNYVQPYTTNACKNDANHIHTSYRIKFTGTV